MNVVTKVKVWVITPGIMFVRVEYVEVTSAGEVTVEDKVLIDAVVKVDVTVVGIVVVYTVNVEVAGALVVTVVNTVVVALPDVTVDTVDVKVKGTLVV